MTTIKKVHAREILDSRGFPTIEVEVELSNGIRGRAAVPSGASTGAHEAHELRDQDKKRYFGKGVKTAVKNVLENLGPKVQGLQISNQKNIDEVLLKTDGSKNKSNLGANAILGVSLAALKANALAENRPLFQTIGGDKAIRLPVPLMNVINGGAHADNGVDVQEFMIAPVCGGRFSESLRAGSEIFHTLKKILSDKGLTTAVGDEGGFAPKLKKNEDALALLTKAIEKAGYRPGEDVFLALDVAATEFFKADKSGGKYTFEGKKITSDKLGEIYSKWTKKYPIQSIEDGFAEDDWAGWKSFTDKMGKKIQLVGDDLFVTNPERLQKGIENKTANAILIKVNQIGSFTETEAAVRMAQKAKYHAVMSHRSGETEDATIADLAVGLGTEQIKTGSLCRGERTAKYNQLLRIEDILGTKAQYWGRSAFEF